MQELRRNMQAEKQRVTARETPEDARRKILLGSLCVPYGDEDLQATIATRITAHLPAGEQEVWPAPFPLVDAEKRIEAAGNVRDPNAAERGAGDAGVTAKNSECALTSFSGEKRPIGTKTAPGRGLPPVAMSRLPLTHIPRTRGLSTHPTPGL